MQPDISGKLAGLRARFAERAAADLAQVESLAVALTRGDRSAAVALEQLGHRLAGAAGSFGFGDLGRSARDLENAAARIEASKRVEPAEVLDAAAALRKSFDEVLPRS